MGSAKKLFRGSILRNMDFFSMVLVTLVMSPFIVHTLGDRLYGFWTVVGSFIGYYGLLDFGLTSAIGRYLSRGIGQGDIDEIRKVASTSFVVMVGIGVLALCVTIAAVVFCPIFIKDLKEIVLFRQIILLMGTSIAISFPIRVYNSVLYSHLRYDYMALTSIAKNICVNAFIYYYLKNGGGLLTLTLINVFGSVIQQGCLIIYCKRTYPEIQIACKYYEKSKIKLLIDYSGKTFVAQLADMARFRVDALVIAGTIGLQHVTYYSIGARLMDYFMQFMISSIGMLTPLYSHHEGSGNVDAVKDLFEKTTKIGVVLSIFVGVSIIFYGKPFILKWMGPGFESSYYVALILVVGYMTDLAQTSSVNLLYGISKHNYYAVTNVCEGLLNLLLSLILVRFYGIFGVALGTTISMVFFKIFIQPVYVCRCINFSIKKYYIEVVLFNTVKTFIPLELFFMLIKGHIGASYLHIALNVVAQMIIFIPFLFYTILNREERLVVIGILRNSK